MRHTTNIPKNTRPQSHRHQIHTSVAATAVAGTAHHYCCCTPMGVKSSSCAQNTPAHYQCVAPGRCHQPLQSSAAAAALPDSAAAVVDATGGALAASGDKTARCWCCSWYFCCCCTWRQQWLTQSPLHATSPCIAPSSCHKSLQFCCCCIAKHCCCRSRCMPVLCRR